MSFSIRDILYTSGKAVRGNLEFSIVPKDTLACGIGEMGIELPTFWSGFLLSHKANCLRMVKYSKTLEPHTHRLIVLCMIYSSRSVNYFPGESVKIS